MSYEEVKAYSSFIGLILFFTLFVGIVGWTFLRPNAKKISEECAQIPLNEDNE